MALDGDLQQLVALYCYSDSAIRSVVCSLWLVGPARSDSGAVPILEYRYAVAQIAGISAYYAPA